MFGIIRTCNFWYHPKIPNTRVSMGRKMSSIKLGTYKYNQNTPRTPIYSNKAVVAGAGPQVLASWSRPL